MCFLQIHDLYGNQWAAFNVIFKIKGKHTWIMSQESMFADGFSEIKHLTFYEVFEKIFLNY